MTAEATSNSKEFAEVSRRESDDESELVSRAKARSPEAWAEIYDRNYRKLFRYLNARLGDHQTAEDLTSAVFVEALKGIDSYVSRGRPLLAWLYRIAHNVLNYHYRSSFRRAAREGGQGRTSKEAAGLGRAREANDPQFLVEGWDLRSAVMRLSEDQREVIILRYFVGLTSPEAARVLGKGERAVYSLQTRAIKALRRQLL